jgi:hypothetical protein
MQDVVLTFLGDLSTETCLHLYIWGFLACTSGAVCIAQIPLHDIFGQDSLGRQHIMLVLCRGPCAKPWLPASCGRAMAEQTEKLATSRKF